MAHKILILDDDADFNSLLTDIFEQADYEVTSCEDPVEAQKVFADGEFDLVVTDHRMPEMTGSEFMLKIKSIRPEVPVIMVSGYLENDTIRDLIKEGVGGVFLKPLNIFSLLERTAELIEESAKSARAEGAEEDGANDAGTDFRSSRLGFRFRSYPCKSEVSIAFAEQLHSLRNFKSTLSLIGGKGSHFRTICEDIRNFYEGDDDCFLYFSSSSFTADEVLRKIREAAKGGASRVTCVILSLESMSAEQKAFALTLARREGELGKVKPDLRLIFCVNGDLDVLYDAGDISEQLYIVLGTAEVTVPSLGNCPEDIPFLAQQMAFNVVREKGLVAVPRFDGSAREYLKSRVWENNHAGLRELVTAVMSESGSPVITASLLRGVENGDRQLGPAASLEAELGLLRDDFVRAAGILLDSDADRVAAFLATQPEKVEKFLRE